MTTLSETSARLRLEAFATEDLPVSDSAKALTSSVFAPGGQAPARFASLVVTDNSIYFNVNEVTPTDSDEGRDAGEVIEVWGINNIRRFRAIRQTADAVIRATYYH